MTTNIGREGSGGGEDEYTNGETGDGPTYTCQQGLESVVFDIMDKGGPVHGGL